MTTGSKAVAKRTALFAVLAAGCAGRAPQPEVARIAIVGNRALSDRAIKSGLATREESWLPFAEPRPYDPLALAVDLDRVVAFYRAQGYFAARVIDHEVRRLADGRVSIVVRVEEGPPTRIASLDVDGLPAPVARPRAPRLGERMVHERYLELKGEIERRLLDAGYAFARADGRVTVDLERHTADIAIDVDAGPRARFGDVVVHGNRRVSADGIRRQAAFGRGERFSLRALRETRERLYATGLFRSVRVDYSRDARGEAVDVDVRVEEALRYELQIGGGVSLENRRQQARLRTAWTTRGLFGGRLDTLRLDLTAGYVVVPDVFRPERRGPAGAFTAELTRHELAATRLRLRARLDYGLDVQEGYNVHGPRARLGLERPLGRALLVGGGANLQYLDFFDIESSVFEPRATPLGFGFRDPYRLAFVDQIASLDLRDDPIETRRGLLALAAAEESWRGLGSDFDYVRTDGELRGFLPAGRRVVFAARGHLGMLFPRGDENSPITRRFYAGGPNSHRGFGFRRLSPFRVAETGERVPVGGDALLEGSIEARVEVLRLRGAPLGLVAFVDAGDVAAARTDLSLSRLHWAAGGGLRYATPVGPVRADVGVRLNRLGPGNPDPGQRVAISVSLGQAF